MMKEAITGYMAETETESYFNHSIILSRVTQSCMTTDKIDKETFLGCIVNLAMYLLLAFNKSLDFNE